MNDEPNNVRRYPSDDGPDSGNDIHPSVERLSEYLDGANDLGSAEREAITGHVAGCQACQAVLTDLQLMVQTLGSLPEREAPRSFALTRDMLQPAKTPVAPEPIVLRESVQWHARHAGKVRWATAVAAMLFVFVISADLVTNGLRGGLGTDDADGEIGLIRPAADSDDTIGAMSADEPASIPTAAAAEEAVLESAEAPVSDAAGEDTPDSAELPPGDDAEVDDRDETALRAIEDDVDGEAKDMSALSMETEEISDEPAEELAATSADSSQMRWRVIEVSLALVLALLLAVMIGLPKQRGMR